MAIRVAGRTWTLSTTSRVLSIVVVVAYIVVILARGGGGESVLRLSRFLVLPMACIWFADAMGSIRWAPTSLASPVINSTTPGVMVAVGGWILLLAPAVAWMILNVSEMGD